MGSTKFILAGLLALALVSSASGASKKCEYTGTGAKTCQEVLNKDDTLQIKCGSTQTTWVPDNALSAPAEKVCVKAMADLNATCATDDQKTLVSLVPGAEITKNNGMQDITISNKKTLSEDKEVWAVCKDSGATKGYSIKITFKKSDSSAASGWATIPAVFLGSLTTLVALLRA